MFSVYSCHYQYKKVSHLINEEHYILAQSPEECRELLLETLNIRNLEYFSYTLLCSISGISKEIVENIGLSQYNRISQLKNKKTIDGVRFPTYKERSEIEITNDRLAPKALVERLKEWKR